MNAPHTPSDTRTALQMLPVADCSRSLYFDRFARPDTEKDARRDFFRDGLKTKALPLKRDAWLNFLLRDLGLKHDTLLFGKLQARLMVNMAGGVMENAGLCLDRLTGIPYIPGSAVKGCARRMAVQLLLEAPADQKADLLTQIALIFGWSDLEWRTKADLRPRRNESDEEFQKRWEQERSDFAYACGDELWQRLSDEVMAGLAGRLGVSVTRNRQGRIELPSFAGSVSFLPAYPIQAPNPDLELDVVTCHHRDYYAGKLPVATDTEEPNPVVFPAVAPGHVFAFAVVPLRNCDATLLNRACNWLKAGLETFGLGAKTNAGYGWFDCTDNVQQAARTAIAEAEKRRQEEQRRKEAEQREQAEGEQRRKKAEEQKKLTASMTPAQKADYELAQLTDEQFRGRLDNFTKRDLEEQKGIVRALRLTPEQPGSRRKLWDELKTKAQKGGKPAQIEQAIRAISKQMYPGKEGKMP